MFNVRLKRSVAGVCLLNLGLFCLRAQTNALPPDLTFTPEPPPLTNSVTVESPPERPDHWPLSISGGIGTTGAGGTAGWRFLDHVGVRGGMDYLDFSVSQTFEDVRYIGRVRLMSESAALDFYPGKKKSFRITVGAWFSQNQFNGSPDPNQTITIGGVTFSPGDFGNINLRIKQQPISPYVSIGGNFFCFDHARHWSLGGEIGVAYSPYDVSLTQSGGIAPPSPSLIASERKRIEDNLNKIPVWPILKVYVSCSF